jgi:hypothetical protein
MGLLATSTLPRQLLIRLRDKEATPRLVGPLQSAVAKDQVLSLLRHKGYEEYLPKRSERESSQRIASQPLKPLFPGYL